MLTALMGTKIGMTQVFTETGTLVPVTVLEVGPCWVVQRKTAKTDGYDAVQVGYRPTKPHRINKPKAGHLAKAGVQPVKYLKEFRVEDANAFEPKQQLGADIFSVGDIVDVTGVSKGRGFQGVIKRHGMHGGPAGHGSMSHRHIGSVGSSATPARIRKGLRMPGQMGAKRSTIIGLEIVRVDPEKNLVLVKGGVPGPNGSVLVVRKSVRNK